MLAFACHIIHGRVGDSQNALFSDFSELDDFCELLRVSEAGVALGLELKSRPGIVKVLNISKMDF